jgi:peptidoglycan/xylan/chitin deacetylase (PgdA/CDA1 family)
MDRRQFIRLLALEAIILSLGRPSPLFPENAMPQIAITMDDPHTYRTPRLTPQERNRAILNALRSFSGLKSALFVCGHRVDSKLGKKILHAWDENGHILGNHTYSHLFYHSEKIDPHTYMQDILRGEAVVKEFSHFKKLFRFPFLKEGDTTVKRDEVRAFLKEQGYEIGYVTIDTSDWYIDARMEKRLNKKPDSDLTPYRDYYLSHIWDRANFYDSLSRKVIGRNVKHTLLLHHNLLSALFLGDLLRMFKSKGWQLIDAEEAFKDPVFSARPNVLPAGESIIWALAKESGRFEEYLRYPGESDKYEEDKINQLGL